MPYKRLSLPRDTFLVTQFRRFLPLKGLFQQPRDITPVDTVEQNSLMKTAGIEAAILLVVGDRWTKVAMIIANVVEAMGTDLPTGDEGWNWFLSTLSFL